MRDPLQAVNGPSGPVPLRRSASIRRTSTVDMTYPGGEGGFLRLDGRARDAVSHAVPGAPTVIGEAMTSVRIIENRTIEDITGTPDHRGLRDLVGCRGGGHLRSALAEFLPDQLELGTPLYLLLDDISGCSLIAGVAFMPIGGPRPTATASAADRPAPVGLRRRAAPEMEGVCIGFRPGSSALAETRSGVMTHRFQIVPSLVHPDDPDGWHELDELPPVSARRARRIDVWREPDDGTVMIEASFQDSAGHPVHGRVGVHEYIIRAMADPRTLELISVEPDARILPFLSCPDAVDTAAAVVGTHLAELRTTVLERLARTNGCTHLNDALRAMAEVPVLLGQLDAELANTA